MSFSLTPKLLSKQTLDSGQRKTQPRTVTNEMMTRERTGNPEQRLGRHEANRTKVQVAEPRIPYPLPLQRGSDPDQDQAADDEGDDQEVDDEEQVRHDASSMTQPRFPKLSPEAMTPEKPR